MKFYTLIIFFICLTSGLCYGQRSPAAPKVQKAFTEEINDSTSVEVFLQYDAAGEPEHYFCRVNTAVCEHGLCRLMVINVFWDLLGNFLKYDFPPGESLTKLDHQEFSREDHEQLYKILSNKASILRDYPADDLIDRRSQPASGKADAVSSATRVDVKDAVVSGAVYSTYVLWHIVNGPIAFRIIKHSEPLLTKERVNKMFYSANFYYQYFALNSITPGDSLKYLREVIHLVKNGSSYIPYFAIEKIPVSAWSADSCQRSLLGFFKYAEFELQNFILDRITGLALSPHVLDLLVSGMQGLRDSQMLKALAVVRNHAQLLHPRTRENLARLTHHSNRIIAQDAREILDGEERNK